MEAQCQCPRGQVLCHHMVAVLFYVRYNISSSDVECRWNAPRTTNNEEKVFSMSDLFPAKEFKAAKRTATDEEVEKFRSMLGRSNVVGFSWLLKPDPSQIFI